MPIEVLEYADPHAPYGLRGVGEAPTISSGPGGRRRDPRRHRSRPAPGADPARGRDRDPMRLHPRRPRRRRAHHGAGRRRAGRGLPRRLRRPAAGAHRLRARRPGRAPASSPPTDGPPAPPWPRTRPTPRRWPRSGRRPGPGRRGLAAAAGQAGREPVEDLRIDLEDGYRGHPAADEDAHAVAAVRALAGGDAPPYWGVRFKSFEAATRARGLRTLDLVLGTALERGPLPDGFRLTLPKVTSVEQVLAMVETCERLEAAYGLDAGRLRFEVQVETPQVVLGPDGTATVARLVHAGRGPVQRAALRHLRLHRRARDRRRAAGHGPPGRGPRQARDAAGRGRHRRGGLRRLDQRAPGRLGRAGARRLGAALPARAAARWSAGSTRAGTCTRPSCRPATWRPSCSSAPGWTPRPAGCATTSAARRAPCSTSRPRPGRWPGSCAAGCTAAP